MDVFLKAKQIRLVTVNDKYLTAEEDGESVCLSRLGSSEKVVWTVECDITRNIVRLKSCFGRYLCATNVAIVSGHAGKRVIQILGKEKPDVSIEWEPIRDGFQVRLKTLMGDFLRPRGGLPPWRNTITHDVPHLHKTKEKLLWDIEVVKPRNDNNKLVHPHHRRSKSDDLFSRFSILNMDHKPFAAMNFYDLHH